MTTGTAGTGTQRVNNPKIGFWRPYQGKGAAAMLEFSTNRNCFFLSIMPEGGQNGKKFDADKRINCKLGLQDVGAILSVINGRAEGLGTKDAKGYFSGLVHKIEGNDEVKYINLAPNEKGQYFLGISSKKGQDAAVRLSVSMGAGDMELTRQFLNTYLPSMFTENTEQ